MYHNITLPGWADGFDTAGVRAVNKALVRVYLQGALKCRDNPFGLNGLVKPLYMSYNPFVVSAPHRDFNKHL